MNSRQLFLQHVAQTSDAPLCLEIEEATGCILKDVHGKEYIDLIGGISVCNVGHRNEHVLKAIKHQVDKYMHVMVYGELIQAPQVLYAEMLTKHLHPDLHSVYFTNSGSEATEGAMKLAKRATGRSKIISFKNSYHGSTQGALSVMGSEYWQQAFRPLLPNVYQYEYGSKESVNAIDDETACIIMEPVQSEAGVRVPDQEWMTMIRKKCDDTGCLLIYDEIQTGFGRTGSLFRFQHLEVVPDILLLGKALGGGMPLGAFVAHKKLMDLFSSNPVLGHITTFGGHPVCCAAGMAAFEYLLNENLHLHTKEKEDRFKKQLVHRHIKQVNSCGLLIAVYFESYEINKRIIDTCIENGLFTDWFLFASNCLRIAPPLCISLAEIDKACTIILQSIDKVLD